RVRRRYGDKPEVASYQQRFPKQYAELQKIIQIEASRNLPGSSSPSLPSLPSGSAPASGDNVLPIGGGYKLLKRLGGRRFADVYRAEAPGGVLVAVKQLRQPLDHDEAQREQKALELVKNLRHPYLLQVQAFCLWADRLFIVMELADGTLRDRLKQCKDRG